MNTLVVVFAVLLILALFALSARLPEAAPGATDRWFKRPLTKRVVGRVRQTGSTTAIPPLI